MDEHSSWFRETRSGLQIFVRLTPRSSRDAVEGVAQMPDGHMHLKARVRAVPEDGKANRALEKLLADWLGVPRRDVSVAAGMSSRLKTVAIVGDAAGLAAAARDRVPQGG